MGLSDYVRAEFLRNRGLEFVKAARALGLSNARSSGATCCPTR
jgi:microcin C transport system permease protein